MGFILAKSGYDEAERGRKKSVNNLILKAEQIETKINTVGWYVPFALPCVECFFATDWGLSNWHLVNSLFFSHFINIENYSYQKPDTQILTSTIYNECALLLCERGTASHIPLISMWRASFDHNLGSQWLRHLRTNVRAPIHRVPEHAGRVSVSRQRSVQTEWTFLKMAGSATSV